ncbi:hypothetical protein [Treponema phagedenis]|uniref:hypothetical protein n=1 Tax=Treponema phagedenis TaxID=162 RepID=UPI001CA3DFFA|nr:hypothetical protein [Treponema phagedenis]
MLNPVSFTNTFALKRRFCLEPLPSMAVLIFDVHVKNQTVCVEPRASVPVLSFAVRGKNKPASLKASILHFCVDALKHRLEFGNGGQFTIVMLKSAVPYC